MSFINRKVRLIAISDRSFIIRMSLIVLALFTGVIIQELILYPNVAYLIRDLISWIFRSLGFLIVDVNSSKGIGLSFNDYVLITSPTEVDILHGVLSAGCISFAPFLGLATDYSVYHFTILINKEELKFKTISAKIKKSFLLIFLFLPFTFLRFVLILFVFLLLWNTPLWTMHYFIGHDLIGNIVLFTILIGTYSLLVHSEYWKQNFNYIKQKLKETKRIIKSMLKSENK